MFGSPFEFTTEVVVSSTAEARFFHEVLFVRYARSFSSWPFHPIHQDPSVGVPTANNFLKGVSFSPDGTCLLSSSDDTVLRVFEVPDHALKGVRNMLHYVSSQFRSRPVRESDLSYCR